jgi:cytosine/adenosine deaminase-related metal-dependent hydrolase
MIMLSGADLVLPDRLLGPGSVVIDGNRIVDVRAGAIASSPGDLHFDLHGHYIVPTRWARSPRCCRATA